MMRNRWLDQDKTVLIDIREADEYAREHIAGSRLVPLSGFDPNDFPSDHGKIGVFHCNSGNRTCQAAPDILKAGFTEIYHLDGGIPAWKKAGSPINHHGSTMPRTNNRRSVCTPNAEAWSNLGSTNRPNALI